MKIVLPNDVGIILNILSDKGYEAYIVGGCVRDSLLNRTPSDWDITTNAKPKTVVDIFENLGHRVIPTGMKHGTITIMIDGVGYEVTTYRVDGEYDDNRHPKKVTFTNSLKEDLSRRDFAINAMAYSPKNGLIDIYGGIDDLSNKEIRCVGNAIERFSEDALRMIRAIRFSCQLGFELTQSVINAICDLSSNIKSVSAERVREEFCKILASDKVTDGICHLGQSGLMWYIIPELYATLKFKQHNKHHDKDIFWHTLSVVENVEPKLELRLSALLHDIGKSKCFSKDENDVGHFYNHARISADMSKEILKRLKFDNKTIDEVGKLIYSHMISTDLNTKSIKKLINRVGKNNIYNLIELMISDRKGCAKGYRNYDDILELKNKVSKILNEKQPLSVKDLDINGYDLIKLGYKGREIGEMLDILLASVLESPELNSREVLLQMTTKWTI